ncbi:hypothetical protein GO283_05086 [Ralstonia solanacearum]|nr:hypothetical protein [Ralstonia solanacearum]NKA96527.1 hypothetical protein [Ralstonia solanacearum]
MVRIGPALHRSGPGRRGPGFGRAGHPDAERITASQHRTSKRKRCFAQYLYAVQRSQPGHHPQQRPRHHANAAGRLRQRQPEPAARRLGTHHHQSGHQHVAEYPAGVPGSGRAPCRGGDRQPERHPGQRRGLCKHQPGNLDHRGACFRRQRQPGCVPRDRRSDHGAGRWPERQQRRPGGPDCAGGVGQRFRVRQPAQRGGGGEPSGPRHAQRDADCRGWRRARQRHRREPTGRHVCQQDSAGLDGEGRWCLPAGRGGGSGGGSDADVAGQTGARRPDQCERQSVRIGARRHRQHRHHLWSAICRHQHVRRPDEQRHAGRAAEPGRQREQRHLQRDAGCRRQQRRLARACG